MLEASVHKLCGQCPHGRLWNQFEELRNFRATMPASPPPPDDADFGAICSAGRLGLESHGKRELRAKWYWLVQIMIPISSWGTGC